MAICKNLALACVMLLVVQSIAAAQRDVLDIHHLPLGDGRVVTTPTRGSVMACRAGPGGMGGAQGAAPWIHGATWDLTEKPHVQGNVTWPQARFSIRDSQLGRIVERVIAGNGLPVQSPTGTFPIVASDPTYRFDRNPNAIRAYDIALNLPAEPQQAPAPSCVPGGMIAIALNGVAIFNALDAGGRDAVAHEAQDICGGHPQPEGNYHYHGPSPCLPGADGREVVVGYALDGFAITSLYDAGGRELTNADLDDCHGRVSTIAWNGGRAAIYHYVLTREYPYTIGCFRGTPLRLPPPRGGLFGPGGGRPPPGRPPF